MKIAQIQQVPNVLCVRYAVRRMPPCPCRVSCVKVSNSKIQSLCCAVWISSLSSICKKKSFRIIRKSAPKWSQADQNIITPHYKHFTTPKLQSKALQSSKAKLFRRRLTLFQIGGKDSKNSNQNFHCLNETCFTLILSSNEEVSIVGVRKFF